MKNVLKIILGTSFIGLLISIVYIVTTSDFRFNVSIIFTMFSVVTFLSSIPNIVFYKNKTFPITALSISLICIALLGYIIYINNHPIF